MEFKDYQIDEQEIRNRLDNILSQDFESLNRKDALRIILNVIDLTTLEGSDTNQKIKDMCYQARRFKVNGPDIPNVAAVCFYPPFAALAKSQLHDTGINVACVAGAFPSGQAPLDVRVAEVRYAAEQGADEIDMVISRGRFLEGDFQYVYDEVAAIKEAGSVEASKLAPATVAVKNSAPPVPPSPPSPSPSLSSSLLQAVNNTAVNSITKYIVFLIVFIS